MRARTSILTVLAILLCTSLGAQSLQEKQQRRDRLEKDIAILRKQVSESSSRSDQAISTLGMIQAQKSSRQKLVSESDRAIAGLNTQISSLQKEIKTQQALLDTLQEHYSRLVLGAYKNRDVKIWYMYILSSENVSQAFRRFGYFKSLSVQIGDQAERIRQVQLVLNEKRSELVDLRSSEQNVRNERARELKRIQADEAQQKQLVSKLKRDTKAYQKSLKAKQDEMRVLNQQIDKMLRQAGGSGGGKGTQGKKKADIDYVLDKQFENNKGKLPWPVEGPVVEHYGAYQNKELKLSLFNNGINIACEDGSPIKCVFDGTVSNIMMAPGYGQCILVQHGEYFTLYCKVKTAHVHQGDKVKTGQVIGEVATIMGKTQLYFLVWRKQKYLDPEKWLR